MKFTKATRNDSNIKLAIAGVSGSGKTFSALKLARGLVGSEGKIAVVDTENGSSKLYSDLNEFFHCDLPAPYHYKQFIEAIKEAEKAGFDAIVIDSLSHLWQSILEEKSNIDRKGGNSFSNWSVPTQHLNETIQTLLQAKIHVICCLRSKTEYVMSEEVNAKGKTVSVPKKVGTSPVMREGIDYEFSLVFDVGMDHRCSTSKDRSGLFTDKTFQITEETGQQIASWLKTGSVAKPEEPVIQNEDTDNFLELIHESDSKESLGKIGLRIKESGLPESQKAIIRDAYREKFNALA